VSLITRASTASLLAVFLIGLVVGGLIVYIIASKRGLEGLYRETVTITQPIERVGEYNYTILIDKDYYNELIKWLPRANSSVYVIMFVIKYDPRDPKDPVNRVLDILINLSKKGVDVKIVVDDETKRSYPETIDYLLRHNMSIKLDESASRTTHTKLVIIDGKIVFFGSHNWTQSALTQNHEVSIMIISKEVANKLIQYFNSIWSSGRAVS
jgi:phosphatidylserine/phosphatidylglycerophosphate/cardiolipin synthase-like enzyme